MRATTSSTITRLSLEALIAALWVMLILFFLLCTVFVYTVFLDQERAYARPMAEAACNASQEVEGPTVIGERG